MSTAILRSRILDLAIRGQLVPQDPNEGTAMDLLKEIAHQRGKAITPITDNVPFSIPDNWCWVKLGDIAESVLYGVSASAQKEGKYKLLRITDIQDNKVNWDTVPYTDFALRDIEKYYLQMGDIVFARTGATVGKSYLIEDELKDVIFASYLIRVRLIDVFNKYVISFFNSYEYWRQITQYSVGIGQPNCNGTSLKNLLIPLPPLCEQRRIVAKVEELLGEVDKIEQAQTDITQAATILRSRVLDSALRGELTHSNTDEWENAPLEKCAEIKDNLRAPINANEREKRLLGKKQEDLYPYYGATGQVGFIDDFLLDGDYILLGEDGAPFLDPNAPKAYLVHGKCWVNNHAHVLRALGDSKFLMYALNAINYRPFVTGTTRLKLTQGEMKKITIPLPPLAEQHRIVAKIEQLFSEIDKLK